jgi:hypothetical protein
MCFFFVFNSKLNREIFQIFEVGVQIALVYPRYSV